MCNRYTKSHDLRSLNTYLSTNNKYVGSPNCLAEIYAGHVACCPLVSHGEHADRTDRYGQTDGRQTVTLRFSLNMASIMINS